MRTISAVVKDAIDNTSIDHLVTQSNADELVEEIVDALSREGYVVS